MDMAARHEIALDHAFAVKLQDAGIGKPASQCFANAQWIDSFRPRQQQSFGNRGHSLRGNHLIDQLGKLAAA